MKYAFIDSNRRLFKISSLCRVLQVSRSGFYDWIHRPVSLRAQEDARLLKLIQASYDASGGIYGSKRIFLDLREVGETCGKNRIAKIMKANKIRAIHGYKIPRARYGRPALIAPNRLEQQFTVNKADAAWVTDITYIRTWQGWLYLAIVLDLYSRKVVGWSMQPSMKKELVIDALMMAVWRRRPQQEVIIHSDQGSQYGSDGWRRFCKEHKLLPSMSRRGNCYDNAVAESFFSSLKKERIRKKIYRSRAEAKADVFDYIEVFYNKNRRHSHLNGMSPQAFESATNHAL